MKRPIDIVCAGELLVDFITAEFVQTLEEASLFKRVPGGSPANLCMNLARLGHSTKMVSCIGKDDMGDVLKSYMERLGVDVSGVIQIEEHPTTLILVTRSAGVSNYVPYRGADSYLSVRQFPHSSFDNISIFHTTCFAMSRLPAQRVILEMADKAKRAGCQLSIDINYADKIWPDRLEAQKIVLEYIRMSALIKISDVDWLRLYGDVPASADTVLDHFLKNGAKEVCYTMGEQGCWIADTNERHFLTARPVEVKDTTGAGDAFWAGYLAARIDEKSLLERATAARKMAEMKLGHFGPLPDKVERDLLYEE